MMDYKYISSAKRLADGKAKSSDIALLNANYDDMCHRYSPIYSCVRELQNERIYGAERVALSAKLNHYLNTLKSSSKLKEGAKLKVTANVPYTYVFKKGDLLKFLEVDGLQLLCERISDREIHWIALDEVTKI